MPLFVTGVRRAEALILAMEARCYVSGEGRTEFVVLKSSRRDYLVVLLTLAYFIVMTWTRWPMVREVAARLGFPGL